jgi:hypothetical protein
MTRTLKNRRFFATITFLFAAAAWFNLNTNAGQAPATSLVLGQPYEMAPAQVAGTR